MDFDLLDNIAKMRGWNVDKKNSERAYIFGNKKVLLRKTDSGYKIILLRKGKMYDSDVTKCLGEARLLLGETLMFRSW